MLIKDLYKVFDVNKNDDLLKFSIQLNSEHKIFEGHFPGNPVLPGVVQLQIIKDVFEEKFNSKFQIISIKDVKYPAVIQPFNQVYFELKYKSDSEKLINVSGKITQAEKLCTKVKFKLSPVT